MRKEHVPTGAIQTDDRDNNFAELHDDDQTRSSLDFGVGHTSLRSG